MRGPVIDRWAALIAVVAATAVGAAGCGGSAGDDASGSPANEFTVRADTTVSANKSLTKAALIERVNEICQNRWPKILSNFSKYSSWQNPPISKADLFARSVRLSYTAGVDLHIFDRIYYLGAPPSQRQAVEAVIGALQEAVERGQRVVRVTNRGQLEALFADYNAKASRYGFDECLVKGSHLPHASKPVGLPDHT
jgi:hypothetical protein